MIAALYAFINLAGFAYAAIQGEGGHALGHIALLVVGAAVVAWRVLPGARARMGQSAESARQLDDLQRSIDALAVSVERIGEAQRYTAKLAQEQAKVPRKTE